MELEQFTELYNRIQEDPSILILGQNYLTQNDEEDSVWQYLSQKLYPELNLHREKSDYPQLWEQVVNSKTDSEKLMQTIHATAQKAEKSEAISGITSLRWSLIYTSAIDGAQADHASKGYTNVNYKEKYPQPKYLNKQRQYRVNLCGDIDFPPPDLKERFQKKKFDKQISNKVSWISNTYLEYFGVLVIEGLDLDYDWLNDDNLFGELMQLPLNSVFWFSAPKELHENANELLKQGILITEEDSFYHHLLRHIPELFEAEEVWEQSDEEEALYTSLTLRFSNNQNRTVRISRSDITRITGDNLCVIDDDMINGAVQDTPQNDKGFAEFLMQKGTPSWYLFNAKKTENTYYIKRDLDEELEKTVNVALKMTGTGRSPIIVHGPSNSGKSMMLANLAIKIAARRRYPVVFIRGELLAQADKRLDRFIDNWFCDTERYGGDRPEKTIVIWDGSGLERDEQDYIRLQKRLFNRNAQVIGSLYSCDSPNSVKLTQELSSAEETRLEMILSSVGSVYKDRYNEIKANRSRSNVLKNRTLLYLLQALFKYEFDSEFQGLSYLLAHQFQAEKKQVENQTEESLEEYVETFIASQNKRAELGVASTFQQQLQLILDRMAVNDREKNKVSFSSEEEKKKEKAIKLKNLSKQIQEINSILAVASEFGVKLPLHLLLQLLRDGEGHSYAPINEDTYKIIEVLRTDTLIEFEHRSNSERGESYYVGFRNTIEAENYICLLCSLQLEDHSQIRKKKETELLYRIIELAETEEETWAVIELARQFGPNGHGMLSEIQKVKRCSDYLEYKDYWLSIADKIIKKFPNDPEAVLVYAHFIREYIGREGEDHLAYYEDMKEKAQVMLESALQQLEARGEKGRAQYDRLSVELCANYQQSLRYSFNPVIYNSIKKRIKSVHERRLRREASESRRDFSSNFLLDILLNAYSAYRVATKDGHDKQVENELSEMICSIDDMLNIDDLKYETKNHDIIQKIKAVYEQLGQNLMENLEEQFRKKNSDIYLFLQARMIWQRSTECTKSRNEDKYSELVQSDRYMIVCRDIPYRTEIPQSARDDARRDAAKVEEFLENNMNIIEQTRSARCIEMLMRAKWYAKTGESMLSEKQSVALTRDEWNNWSRLCDLYTVYYDISVNDPFIPAYFLKGVYEWIYGDIAKSKDCFQKAKEYAVRDGAARTVERLILCSEGTKTPRLFVVQLRRKDNRKYTASIHKETTPNAPDASDLVMTRYGMGVSENVAKYLFDGMQPQEDNQRSLKEGEIRFNLIGAQIGNPSVGRSDQ